MDIAALGFRIDSKQAEKGARDLDKLTASAGKAEGASKRLATATRSGNTTTGAFAQVAMRASGSTAQMATALELATSGHTSAAVATRAHTTALAANEAIAKKAAFQQKMLMFQLNDIGVSLASGMNPLMVIVQQGSQIQQIYAGEGGVRQALRDTGSMIGRVATRIPLLTAAVGAGTAAIAGMRHEINKTSDVTVSFGDVALGVFQTVRDGIYNLLRPAIEAIAPWVSKAWDFTVELTKNWGNNLVRLTLGSFELIKTGVMTLPDAFIVAGEDAANGFISRMKWMVRETVVQINGLLGELDKLADASGLPRPGLRLDMPKVGSPIDLGGDAARKRLGEAWTNADARITEMMNRDYMGEFFDATKANALKNAMDGLGESAGKAAEKAREAYADIVRGAQQFIEQQQLEASTLGMTEEAANALRYEQELLNKAANDNIKLTPQQVKNLKDLAQEMAETEANTNKLKSAYDFAKSTVSGFFNDFRSGLEQGKGIWKSFGDAALGVLGRIGDKLIELATDQLINGFFKNLGGGGGGVLGFIGNMLGIGGGAVDPWAGLRMAKGGAFSQGNVIPFANGGVVSSATMFPMSGGRSGVMGEAGPEAIMPLKRGPDGRLGVSAPKGASAPSQNTYAPTYNIDASNSANPEETRRQVTQALKEYDKGSYHRWLADMAQARKRNAA